MKTNKFENTIRRKLESIQPDFQEENWAKMQQYMQVHTPPTLWQQYGSWIGYAAAASITTVMAFLYVNQLSQNDSLVSDVKNLKGQIEVIKNLPATITKTDTIYLVQKEPVIETRYLTRENTQPEQAQIVDQPDESSQKLAAADAESVARGDRAVSTGDRNATLPENRVGVTSSEAIAAAANNEATGKNSTEPARKKAIENAPDVYVRTNGVATGSQPSTTIKGSVAHVNGTAMNSLTDGSADFNETTLRPEFGQMEVVNSVEMNNGGSLSRKMNYTLASRLTKSQVQKYLNASKPAIKTTQIAAAQNAKAPASGKKVEQTAKAENVIPRFNIKAPYRFGGGINMEANGQAKTVVAEVLVAKKFSITTGISWLKVKPMEFFTEKVFREKNKQDFKHAHPGEVPLAFDVYNIKVNPTIVQIPLTVAFRNDLKNDWAYYAGVGTNVTLKSEEDISFDCKIPNKGFYNKTFEKKSDTPPINSVNFSVGIEKTWYPIVIQAEGYLFTYFKPLTPLSNSAGPGVKFKLLYQIGRKM